MREISLAVNVRVRVLAPAVPVYVEVEAAAARELPQGVRAQRDQHEADRELKHPLGSLAHAEVKHDHGDARDDERDGVTDAPESAHQRRHPEALALADDCRDGRQVVGLDRVLKTQHEAEREHRGD